MYALVEFRYGKEMWREEDRFQFIVEPVQQPKDVLIKMPPKKLSDLREGKVVHIHFTEHDSGRKGRVMVIVKEEAIEEAKEMLINDILKKIYERIEMDKELTQKLNNIHTKRSR